MLALPALAPAAAARPRTVPLVFVSGTTGTKLAEPRTGKLVWGRTAALFRPRDRGYSLALPLGPGTSAPPQFELRPVGPLLNLRLLFWKKRIYGPLLEHFVHEGRRQGQLDDARPGDDLFFFDYDWRRDSIATVIELADRLSRSSLALGATEHDPVEFDLVCQSNAAKICRYLVKYGPLTLADAEAGKPRPPAGYRIRKLILVGAANGGALRTLQLMTRGRRCVAVVGRKISQETFFSVRPLFADLPIQSTDLFFGDDGETIEVDLADPDNWIRYDWSIFARKARQRLERGSRADLFGSRDDQTAYLAEQLDRAARLNRLLASNAPQFEPARYYRLESESVPTAARALLHQARGRWRLCLFDDRRVARDPRLRALAVGAGDGHATLASQRSLSAQEEAALAGSALVAGRHFEMIIGAEGLTALSGFLAD